MDSIQLTKYLSEALSPDHEVPSFKIDSKVIQHFYKILSDAPQIDAKLTNQNQIIDAQKKYKARANNQLEKFKKVCKNSFDSLKLTKEEALKRMGIIFDSLLEMNDKVLMGEIKGYNKLADFIDSFLKTSLDSFNKTKTPIWLLNSKLGENLGLGGCVEPPKTKAKFKVYKKKLQKIEPTNLK